MINMSSQASVPLHKHCVVCGEAIPGDQNFCDELCEYKYKSAKRRQQLIFLAFLAAFLILLIAPVLISEGLK